MCNHITTDVTLISTAFLPKQLPPENKPEIALFGRSNVGKSTLINHLFNRKSSNAVARTSSVPGKTASINFYESSSATLVDLPGFGFTQNTKERNKWTVLIETYLKERSSCVCCCLCIDFRHGLTNRDKQFLKWMSSYNHTIAIVFTKVDKVPKSKRESHKQKVLSMFTEYTSKWCLSSSKDRNTRTSLLHFFNNLIDEQKSLQNERK
ncbi:ribosome biogenesis GTP-binding protein YihA/YsxC [Chlamydiia bacterium]|jgi:GTP-binding protein|nr:ribosome biogenesis GTP-binding protein YihA/YsxC [Chlamydiia bacterium]